MRTMAKKAGVKKARKDPAPGEPEVRLFSVEEYHGLFERGILSDQERVELIRGQIYRVTPQGIAHKLGIWRTQEALTRAFGRRCFVSVQVPLEAAEERSEPEPDLAVVRGRPRQWTLETGPYNVSSALLIAEVSYSTVKFDREVKGPLYAAIGVEEYWIVNVRDQALEVHRRPKRLGDKSAYESVQALGPRDSIAPLAAPRRKVRVKDLLP